MRLHHLAASLAVVGLLSGAPSARTAKAAASCDAQLSGTDLVVDTAARVGSNGQRFALRSTRTTKPSGDLTASTIVTRGRTTVLRRDYMLSHTGAVDVTVSFGAGFRGIAQLELTSADGIVFAGTVDGHALAPFTAGSDPGSLTLADGTRLPRLKSKRDVTRALRRLVKKAAAVTCSEPTTAPIRPQAFLDKCDRCNLLCNFGDVKCDVGIVLSAGGCSYDAFVCVLLAELTAYDCASNYASCSGECMRSSDCCPVACPGAVGFCCKENETCMIETNPAAPCCASDKVCGNVCCNGSGSNVPEEWCIDADLSLCCTHSDSTVCGSGCCDPGGTCCGDHCCGAGQACCGSSCCAVGDRCADPAKTPAVCCPLDAGPVCGFDCCPAGDICLPGAQCCPSGDACGSTCCPSHNCVNGACCDPPSKLCGAQCCNGFSTCCNGACCGLGEECVNGSCCTFAQHCGSICCGADQTCTDPTTGTCATCPAGQLGCPGLGDPPCCASVNACCSNGACCSGGQLCCAPIGGGPIGCFDQASCTH